VAVDHTLTELTTAANPREGGGDIGQEGACPSRSEPQARAAVAALHPYQLAGDIQDAPKNPTPTPDGDLEYEGALLWAALHVMGGGLPDDCMGRSDNGICAHVWTRSRRGIAIWWSWVITTRRHTRRGVRIWRWVAVIRSRVRLWSWVIGTRSRRCGVVFRWDVMVPTFWRLVGVRTIRRGIWSQWDVMVPTFRRLVRIRAIRRGIWSRPIMVRAFWRLVGIRVIRSSIWSRPGIMVRAFRWLVEIRTIRSSIWC
jgi:hypothetical protein